MSTPTPSPTAHVPPAVPAAAATTAGGPSVLDRSRAIGSRLGRAASRIVPSTGTLGLMGLGALGASVLHAREPSDDGRLAYTPLPGSFVQ